MINCTQPYKIDNRDNDERWGIFLSIFSLLFSITRLIFSFSSILKLYTTTTYERYRRNMRWDRHIYKNFCEGISHLSYSFLDEKWWIFFHVFDSFSLSFSDFLCVFLLFLYRLMTELWCLAIRWSLWLFSLSCYQQYSKTCNICYRLRKTLNQN